MIALTAYQNPHETLVGFLFLLLGIPVYYVLVAWNNKPKKLLNASSMLIRCVFETSIDFFFFVFFSDKLTILCQKLFICVKED
jgi:hypothetical protein